MQNKYNYTTVTEIPGIKASKEQLERLYTRYKFASLFCEGRRVLEVACGSGQGLGYLAKKAKKVVGGDIDEDNLKFAQQHYKNRKGIELIILDAHQLPFDNESFDLVILYEAIYYLKYPQHFMKEVWRILRKGGILLICTVNKDWYEFNPSPYSYRYFSAPELYNLFRDEGFQKISLYGDCMVNSKNCKDKIISYLKLIAVKLHLIPKTMKGKEFLKRIFFGKLQPLPREIYEGMCKYTQPVNIKSDMPNYNYKILYAVGYKK